MGLDNQSDIRTLKAMQLISYKDLLIFPDAISFLTSGQKDSF